MRDMRTVPARGRHFVLLGAVVACAVLSLSSSAFALNPALDVNQYAHTAWRIREGFTTGVIFALAQTPDGYIWLGTEFGLLRFDGVRNVSVELSSPLPSNSVSRLLAARDGTLWIGTSKGLASWKNGQLTQYAELSGYRVAGLSEGREGPIWVAAVTGQDSKLCGIQNGRVRCDEGVSQISGSLFGVYEDRRDSIWLSVMDGVWRWTPGPPEFHRLAGAMDSIQSFAEDERGALLIGTGSGIQQLNDGKVLAYPLPGLARQHLFVNRLLRDRDKSLWIGTTEGLVHLHQGRTDAYTQSDGLSGNTVAAIFEDREGNIWVATTSGLDRFHETAASPFTANQGLPSDAKSAGAVVADRDGSVWIGTQAGLSSWSNGKLTTIRWTGNATGMVTANMTNSLFQDDRGRLWVSTAAGTGYRYAGRFTTIPEIPGIEAVHAISQDTRGNVWIALQRSGLFRVGRDDTVQRISLDELGRNDVIYALAADPLQGGIWIGFLRTGIAYFKDRQISRSYGRADGLSEGAVSGLRVDAHGALWAATAGGLSRLTNGSIATLTSRNGLPCDSVHWLMEDNARSLWLNLPCGLVSIPLTELETWAAAVDKYGDSTRRVRVTVFDASDGIFNNATPGGYSPRVARSLDGKLWFVGRNGVNVIDPGHLPFNTLAPPVHVEQLTVDHKVYDAATAATGLPALSRDVEIYYTALSFVTPEKNQFRIKLEGWDSDWKYVGNRRQAFYSNLPPRKYRFRVVASNNSGVWNEEGAVLDFSIAPAYYQTTWFRVALMVAALGLLWGAYQFRLRRLAYEFDTRLQERVNERTRIARELHDTLLQSFHGLLFRLQAATNMLPDSEARKKFESAIDQAAQAITEGRDAVQNLRASTVLTNDLAEAIGTLANELAVARAHDDANAPLPVVDIAVEGRPRDLHPLLRDDIYRIAGEALRNAFRHSGARRIEIGITYNDAQLQVHVRDDGKGMAPTGLSDPQSGHFGLPGMRERAEIVGGHLDVWSEVGLGSEVELTIPAAKAYAASRPRRRLASAFARRTGTDA